MLDLMPALWADHLRLCRLLPHHAFAAGRAPDVDEYLYRGLYTYPILVARNWNLHMTNEERLGLPPAFPQALSKTLTSHFGFHCKYDGRFLFQSFHSAYAAKHFLDIMISGVELKWLADDKVLLENGMVIKSERREQLADALEYTPTPTELQWRAPEPYPYTWAAFLGKRRLEMPDGNYTMPKHLHPTGTLETPPVTKERKRPSDQERRARAVAKVRTGDHVTIAQIAEELKTEPRVLRSLLRRLAIDKPAHGWAWPPSEATRIRGKLSGLLRGPKGA